MLRISIVAALTLLGCGSKPFPQQDAATDDANGDAIDSADGGGDANTKNVVACGDGTAMCPIPDEVCCDLTTGADQCVAANAGCAGTSLACDGPEDCPPTEECCLFPDRSQCLTTGICGTTGVVTEVMCHADADCDQAAGEHCCGTAPGPAVDVYAVCRAGACPQ